MTNTRKEAEVKKLGEQPPASENTGTPAANAEGANTQSGEQPPAPEKEKGNSLLGGLVEGVKNALTGGKKGAGKKDAEEGKKGGKKGDDEEATECVETKHDPKNRAVHLHKRGDKYQVLKAATGFSSRWVGERKAERIFSEQVSSSQNQ